VWSSLPELVGHGGQEQRSSFGHLGVDFRRGVSGTRRWLPSAGSSGWWHEDRPGPANSPTASQFLLTGSS
jgi:hypothetical protein